MAPQVKTSKRSVAGLFVSLERWIDSALELAQDFETKEHGQEGRLGSKKGMQAEVIGSQFVLEFVNAALDTSSAVAIAPDFHALHRCDW
jgi:hypothetical protein